MKNYLLFFALIGLNSVTGCAWYNITPVSKSEGDNWASSHPKDGYIIFEPELYFAATITTTSTNKTVKQEITVTPIYLPNPAKAYRITTHNFLAKADFTFNFTDGWKLTSIADKSDNTTIANTLAAQLQSTLSTAKVFGFDGSEATVTNRIILYKPEYDSDGIIKSFTPKGTIEQ
ncbi:MAG TPA: hypothetical protein VGI03_04720 [Verrucomicrobiae bacterium]